MLICVSAWQSLTALYPESAVSLGAPASSFLLPPSAQCSETKKSRGQGSLSNIHVQHKITFGCKNIYFATSGNTLNIIIPILQTTELHFQPQSLPFKYFTGGKNDVLVLENHHIAAKWGLPLVVLVPAVSPLFTLISPPLPCKRWPAGVVYQRCTASDRAVTAAIFRAGEFEAAQTLTPGAKGWTPQFIYLLGMGLS